MAHVVQEDIEAPKYPWEEWTDGQTWILKQGEDFDCTIPSMRAIVHAKARELEQKVTTKLWNPNGGRDELAIQFKTKD